MALAFDIFFSTQLKLNFINKTKQKKNEKKFNFFFRLTISSER